MRSLLNKMMEEEPLQLTKYETARILGARALQLSMNAPILLTISKEKLEDINHDPLKIAEIEFEAKVLPITVKRPLPERIEEDYEEEDEAEIVHEIIPEEDAQNTAKTKEVKSVEKESKELESEREAESTQ